MAFTPAGFLSLFNRKTTLTDSDIIPVADSVNGGLGVGVSTSDFLAYIQSSLPDGLSTITFAGLAANDLFFVFDVSDGLLKTITKDELQTGFA
jgi:hypothetical protein